jgi:hypothetical protein
VKLARNYFTEGKKDGSKRSEASQELLEGKKDGSKRISF